MKKIFITPFLFLPFYNISYSEVSQNKNPIINNNEKVSPYSVKKQYAKIDKFDDNPLLPFEFKKLDKNYVPIIKNVKKNKIYSLIDIYKLATEHNADYQNAKATFLANMQYAPEILGLLLPKLSYSYNLRHDKYNQDSIVSDTVNSNAFELSQILFDWSTWKTYTKAEFEQKSYAMIFAKAEQQLIVNTITDYFEVLKAEQALQFQYANEKWNKSLYKAQKDKYKMGVVSYADMMTSQAQYQQAIASRADAQRTLASAKANLTTLIGIDPKSLLYIQDDVKFGPPEPNNLNFWLKSSYKYNLDISKAKFDYLASKENINIQWGNFFPQASFTADTSVSYNRYSGDELVVSSLPKNNRSSSLTVSAGWNLLNGGVDYAKLKQAKYETKASNYNLLQTKRQVYSDVVNAYETVVLDSIRIDSYKKSVQAGLTSVNAILDGYRAGTETIVDLLNRQATLVESQLNFASSIFNYIEHYTELKQKQGTLTYKDIIEINKLLGKKNIINKISSEK